MRTLAKAVHPTMSGSLSGSMNGRSFVPQPSMHPTRSVPSSCASAEAAGTTWCAAWRESYVEHAACRISQTLLSLVLQKARAHRRSMPWQSRPCYSEIYSLFSQPAYTLSAQQGAT